MENNTTEQNIPNPPVNTEVVPNEPEKSAVPASDYTFNETTIMAALSYLGPLVLVPFLTKKDNPFIMFHVKQGLVLFGILLVVMFVDNITFGMLTPVTMFINLGLLVLSVIGILNALKQKEVAIPLTGRFADKIKL